MLSGKTIVKICDTAGTGAQPAVAFQPGAADQGVIQAQFTATGSFGFEVRLDPDAPWVQLGAAITEATAQPIIVNRAYPQMRINVTANTGTIRVWAQG